MHCAALRVVRVLLLVAALVGGVLGRAAPAAAQTNQKRLLTLYAPRRDSQVVTVGDRVLQELVGQGLPEGLDYFSESLDQSRFFDVDYQRAFRDSLTLKYARYRFDLVVAVGEVPLEFVARNQDQLFKDVPIVYFVETARSHPVPNSTGFVVDMDLAGTVRFARALQPELRHVFVVTSARGTFESTARAQLRPFASEIEVTYLSGLVTAALEARLKALPPQSMVLYVNVDRDGAGQNYRPLDYLDRVSAVANAPVYSWVDSAIGHGIVGGSLKSQSAEFNAIGELALRVLRGASPATIPVSSPDLNDTHVDWRQLQRWRISPSRLPSATIVHFRELSAWDQYKVYIVGVLAGLLAQSALIAGLLLQRRRRREAERQVLEKQSALQSSYERIRDLGARLLTAQDAERARVARELHDDIVQQLVVLRMDLDPRVSGGAGLTEADLAEALQRIDNIQRSTHDLSHRLHPARLQLIGLVAALQELQREFSQSGVVVTFSCSPVAQHFSPDATVCAFRVAQEALQNAVMHGGARRISMRLDGTTDLSLCIEDDGRGFEVDSTHGCGLGLISMRERVEGLGGIFTVDSTVNAGTRIHFRVPLLVRR
jgi:signal transduction histidine kinase